jgi:hypothetical protein
VRGSGRPAASGRLPGSQHGEIETQSTVAKTELVYYTIKVRVEGSRNYEMRGGEIIMYIMLFIVILLRLKVASVHVAREIQHVTMLHKCNKR